jgi:hypothetical protein
MVQFSHWIDELPGHDDEETAYGEDRSDDVDSIPYAIYEWRSNDVNTFQQEEIPECVSICVEDACSVQVNTDRAILSAPYMAMQTRIAAWH